MSHSTERKEKNCLNCHAAIYGRYCHYCGQENIETKESFWHLLTHFFYDITHFDGKFFSTLKYLLFSPGYLTYEYNRGRRADYLHPIRLYVFTSAFFFFVYFTFYQTHQEINLPTTNENSTTKELLERLNKNKTDYDSALNLIKPKILRAPIEAEIKKTDSLIALLQKDSSNKDAIISLLKKKEDFVLALDEKDGKKYKSVKEYDSIQQSLPAKERDGFISRRVFKKSLAVKEKYHDNQSEILKAFSENFQHKFPQMLFASLPLFALLLQLMYIRRKQYYYVNHVVFSIHAYCATFIIILLFLWMKSLFHLIHIHFTGWLTFVFVLLGFFYWYKALRNYYYQSRRKTILKYILLLCAMFCITMLLFFIFMIFSVFSL